MILKGIVDSIENNSVTVYFPEMDNQKTPGITVLQSPFSEYAQQHKLKVNDVVIVFFWAGNMKDGAVIGRVDI